MINNDPRYFFRHIIFFMQESYIDAYVSGFREEDEI